MKRVCKEEFTEVKDSVLTELLGIPTLIVNMFSIRREGNHEVLHLWCSHREWIALCPRCGTIGTTVHEDKERCVRHLDIRESVTYNTRTWRPLQKEFSTMRTFERGGLRLKKRT